MSEIRNKPAVDKHQLCICTVDYKEPNLSVFKNPPNETCFEWSNYLSEFDIKMAPCLNDFRKLRFYSFELQKRTFLIEIYTDSLENISRDPDQDGWICTSRWIYIQDGKIIDPYSSYTEKINNTHLSGYHTKHIFQLIPY